VTVRSTAWTPTSPRVLPDESIRLITAGVIGSLNRNCTVWGAVASTLPSAGSADTSEAWAAAPLARQTTNKKIASPAIRRIVGMACQGFGSSLTPGAGHLLS
jgi:hypothetical protein